MKKEAAFRFIPELIGDFTYVIEMSANPKRLYIETAINTLHMGGTVYQAVVEHMNTNRKKKTKQIIQEKYDELQETRKNNYELEILRNIDSAYERIKLKIFGGNFRDKEVIGFIKLLEKNLKRLLDIFEKMQIEPDNPERIRVEELTRKALRDYKRLITTFIEEEENNG